MNQQPSAWDLGEENEPMAPSPATPAPPSQGPAGKHLQYKNLTSPTPPAEDMVMQRRRDRRTKAPQRRGRHRRLSDRPGGTQARRIRKSASTKIRMLLDEAQDNVAEGNEQRHHYSLRQHLHLQRAAGSNPNYPHPIYTLK